MNDEQLLRYNRQIMLPEVDIEGQQRLLNSRVLIIGMGGLGSPAAMYLAAAGVGELTLADFDAVDLSNLQRQIIHRTADVGRPKVESARDALRALNPEIPVRTVASRIEGDELIREVERADLVVDGSDNFTTRFAVNAACCEVGRPLVSGAAIRFEGQVAVFRGDLSNAPCYRCLYPEGGDQRETCSDTGILAPLTGIIGSIQAVEAIKVLIGLGAPLQDRLLILDAKRMQWRSLKLHQDPHCPVCATKPGMPVAAPAGIAKG